MKRSIRSLVSLLCLVAVVFTQLAVAAYACPAQFFAQTDSIQAPDDPAIDECGGDTDSPALCYKYCEGDQQSIGNNAQSLASVDLLILLPFSPPSIATALPPAMPISPSLHHATSPRLTIRHCCFRI